MGDGFDIDKLLKIDTKRMLDSYDKGTILSKMIFFDLTFRTFIIKYSLFFACIWLSHPSRAQWVKIKGLNPRARRNCS